MLARMRSFGHLQRIGVEATGTYGAGLLRFMQSAGVEVLEVTTPDKHDRRKRGKNDDLDAQNAAHAAFADQKPPRQGNKKYSRATDSAPVTWPRPAGFESASGRVRTEQARSAIQSRKST